MLRMQAVSALFVCTGQSSPFSGGYHSGGMTPGMTGSSYDAKRHVLTSTPGSTAAPRVDQRPDKNIKVTLDNRDLWRKFHTLGTEMIITKSGRFAISAIFLPLFNFSIFMMYRGSIKICHSGRGRR